MRISDWSSDVCSSDLLLVGFYPGTFDPVTNGHRDIIGRACKVADRLVIAVARNAGKGPLFSAEERVEMVRDDVASMDTHGAEVQVRAFDNLLIHFCHEVGASLLVRGLRAVSDFEYEFQMAAMNARLDAGIERSEEHTSELQSLMRISYAVFC